MKTEKSSTKNRIDSRIKVYLSLILLFSTIAVNATTDLGVSKYVSNKPSSGSFCLSKPGHTSSLQVSPEDFKGVIRAVNDLQLDIERVTTIKPNVIVDNKVATPEIVLIGTIGKSAFIDQLIKENKIDATNIEGKWEAFIIQVVDNPLPGVTKALVIAGSDKRGTIYGIYDVSSQIGVSPWYFWADVPTPHQSEIYVLPGIHSIGSPKVKYRGIFLNDEAPALSGWTNEKNGGFNHNLYTKVFELILRLKGNYLWPAMWGNAFNYDDTINPVLADEYGIVMGTSHHEPMLRAQQEWKKFGKGPWNYKTNEQVLKDFWRQGIVNMKNHESLVTIGMRGDGDEPMSEEANIALLERIVKDQRSTIEEVTGKKASETPQLWALYKEVMEYYDKGMRVPDDVTLLLCDDNWGNIRKLPLVNGKKHPGGYGIYYHFDYVGGPRNYKWLNTNQIERTWEQMNLAYEMGVNKIWLVNVGDLKPVEFPIEFFLDNAWDPEKWTPENLNTYSTLWAEKHFGSKFAPQIGRFMEQYTKFNSRRKPEMLSAETYSLLNYREAETVVEEYNKLAKEAQAINDSLPKEYKDAYFELVLHPIIACANLNDMYVSLAKNRLYAKQERASTNDMAARVEKLFKKDAEISHIYNKEIAGGKWNHMMDQTHISYTYWQQPDKDVVPEVKTIKIKDKPEMGVAVEGSEDFWPKAETLSLPVSNQYTLTNYFFEVFNKGSNPFTCTITASKPWIKVSSTSGEVTKDSRIFVSIDWKSLSNKSENGTITITSNTGEKATVDVKTVSVLQVPNNFKGSIETDGYISIEAEHYSNAINAENTTWKKIPNLGRTLSAMSAYPRNIASIKPSENSPRLEYNVFLTDTGKVQVTVYLSPTLNFNENVGLCYGMSVDNELPQIINIHTDNSTRALEGFVGNNIRQVSTTHSISNAGAHTLKFWLVDPGIVLQKIVVDCGGVKPSYLGPPESIKK
jgi:hypothetical protein